LSPMRAAAEMGSGGMGATRELPYFS
jgi:hypothetical protein